MQDSTKRDVAKRKAYYKVFLDHTTLITDTIDVEDFSAQLIQDGVLDFTALEEINSNHTRKKSATKFLDLLRGKQLDHLRKALNAMQAYYTHVYEPIKTEFDRLDTQKDDYFMAEPVGPENQDQPQNTRQMSPSAPSVPHQNQCPQPRSALTNVLPAASSMSVSDLDELMAALAIVRQRKAQTEADARHAGGHAFDSEYDGAGGQSSMSATNPRPEQGHRPTCTTGDVTCSAGADGYNPGHGAGHTKTVIVHPDGEESLDLNVTTAKQPLENEQSLI